jgi:GTP cyclohydrolase I
MAVDRQAAERAVAALLRALGHDPDVEADLKQTPARVAEAFACDLLAGEAVDVAALLGQDADGPESREAGSGLVVVRGVSIATTCPHHLMPALGSATVAYLPGRRLLGLGTIARLVDALARRLTVQEAIGQRVVDALVEHAGARGAYCELTLTHTCLGARGARQAGASVRTVALAGALVQASAAAELGLALGHRRPIEREPL